MNNLLHFYDTVMKEKVGYIHTYGINTCKHAIFIKMSNKQVNMYISAYASTDNNPLIKLYDNHLIITAKTGAWHYKDLERHGLMMNIHWRWERNGNIVAFPNVETIPFVYMKVSYNSSLLTKIPKKIQKAYDDLIETNRQERNAASRSNYHNKQAMIRLNEAEQTGDYNKYMRMDDVFKLHNVTDRRNVIAHFGMDTIIATLDHKLVDVDTVGNNYYELIEIDIPDNGELTGYRKGTYLRMVNPSTEEIHFEGVPNYEVPPPPGNRIGWRNRIEANTVKAALAWRNDNLGGNYIPPRILT